MDHQAYPWRILGVERVRHGQHTQPGLPNMKTRILGLALLGGLVMNNLAAPPGGGPRAEDFNRNWRFAKGAWPGAEGVGFDDSRWESVRLPHDWATGGPYQPEGDPHTGKLPWRGEGWYRATHARLTMSKSLISLRISTKNTYPNLTSFYPVTKGFTEAFTEGCEWQNDAACVA